MLPVYSDTPRLKRNSLNSGWLPQTAVENGLKIRLDPPRIANNSKWNCAKVKMADNPELETPPLKIRNISKRDLFRTRTILYRGDVP